MSEPSSAPEAAPAVPDASFAAGSPDSGVAGAGDGGTPVDAASDEVSGCTRLVPGFYLVAIDTPIRTYLDYVEVPDGGVWRPEVDGWPQLARWENEATAKALRFHVYTPGMTLSPADVMALLPATAPAKLTIDITAAPYRAAVSPADATTSIQAALLAAAKMADADHPVDVVVPPGTFEYGAVLEVAADVRLRGTGGVLKATNAALAAVHLGGDRSGALFLKLTSPATSRGSTPDASGIWVGPRSASGQAVRDTWVVGNDVAQSMSAQVFAIQEVGGVWAFNFAHDGFSDAFHHTGTSHLCQVVANRASGSDSRGDDLYAFVGYAGDGDPVHHCSCLANSGTDGHARGLSAVGAAFIEFENNYITRTQAAGIYVARESSYKTFGSFDINVIGNHIASANQTNSHDGLLAYADAPDSGAASMTFGLVPNAIRNLTVKDNGVADTAAGIGNGFGIEVRSSCDTGNVVGNTVRGGATPGIVVNGTGFTVSANAFLP